MEQQDQSIVETKEVGETRRIVVMSAMNHPQQVLYFFKKNQRTLFKLLASL